ncbi:MAG: hypothetical protein JNM17_29900 [Archangium sp.]|nr:hypothetical protein [Archangium sp.]
MESTDLLMAVLTSLLGSAPVLIAYLVGVIVAVTKWNAHPRPAMFAASGAGLLLITTFIARIAFTVLPMRMRSDGMSAAQLTPMLTGMGIVSGLLHAVGVGLMIGAIFVDRGAASEPPRSVTLR